MGQFYSNKDVKKKIHRTTKIIYPAPNNVKSTMSQKQRSPGNEKKQETIIHNKDNNLSIETNPEQTVVRISRQRY